MSSDPTKFRFCIDRGGTFTDVYAEIPSPPYAMTLKLLSEDPTNYPNAPREGIRRVLEQVSGVPHPREKPLDTSRIEWIRMGTTVATNALLEREGARSVLVTTKGFGDLLSIGNQARPDIFDLKVRKSELLYEQVIEVDERVRVLSEEEADLADKEKVVMGLTGESVEVMQALEEGNVRRALRAAHAKGINAVAVVLLHSYTYSAHEEKIGEIAKQEGFTQVSLSSKLTPMVRVVPRGHTACVDAYLTPKIQEYLDSFTSGFVEGGLALHGGAEAITQGKAMVSFMQSDGGLTPADKFSGFRAILSGPAGGVVGYAVTTWEACGGSPVIGFDMGGTSTDVSRYAGDYELIFETDIAGVKVQAPQLDINTVAAGGGSRLFFKSGAFIVGPESAKAHPGPVCYRKNGYLAVTDANLFLGRLLPAYFPNIFGPTEDEPLDTAATKVALDAITEEVNMWNAQADGKGAKKLTTEQVAAGFLRVANECMCR
jgi:5-oxoprolinase (ATP-hydrolysing)